MDTFCRQSAKIIMAACAAILLSGTVTRANLVITPTFDSTITSDPNAATIESTIQQAIAVYESSFSDNVTVFITFTEMGTGLGQSSSSFNTISYQLYRSHLVSDATTMYDATALTQLPNTTANPVNGSTTMDLNLPNARAIGLTGVTPDGLGGFVSWDSSAGSPDGQIFLNTSIMNLSRAITNSGKWDLLGVTEHEINEVLGLGSALDGLNNGDPTPTGPVGTLDFYRYDQNGNRSFNTVSNAQSYFSIDGKTLLVQFNQYSGGDFHDWFSWPFGAAHPRVQDAFSLNGKTPDMNVELIALDVIGYHLLIPKMTITRTATNQETITWSPSVPGFLLTENTNLLTTNWLNSVSGTNNPAIVTNKTAIKFYRLNHP